MSAIVDWIKKRGAKSGLNQTSSNIRMAGVIVGPFILGWFAVQIFFPQYHDISFGVVFGLWIVGLVSYYGMLKAKAAGYLPFPQSHWFFPDGQQNSYDLLVPPNPNGWEEIAAYQDGTYGYRVNFKDRISYQEADRPYPDIFNYALWKTPANWTDSFKRTGHGEFFMDNLFIDHPSCENIALSVIYWDERGSSRVPVCLVHSCSYIYNKSIQTKGKAFPTIEMTVADAKDLVIKDLKHEKAEFLTRNRYLESEAEQYHKEGPEDIIDLSDKRVEAFFKRHKTIMNAGKKSWLTRLINGRTLGFVLIGLAVAFIFLHLMVGWP
jgi:hypothetical protein